MLGFLQKFRPKTSIDENSILVLDIGTEFVKALIFRTEERHGFVTGYARVHQKLGDMTAGTVADIAGVTANCETAIQQASHQAGVQPEQAVMGIAGELVRGRTTTVTYTRDSPELRIDMTELKAIIQRMQQYAFSEVRRELARETGYTEIDVKLAHAAIIDTRIDGAHVMSPIGFQGKEVTLSVFNAFAPLVHFGALTTIAAELQLDLLTIAAEPYAVAQALITENSTDISAITIDIGGGTTDISLLRGGCELMMRMFAIGGRTFTKRLAQTFNISFVEAEQIKIDYSNNKLDTKMERAVKKALVADVEVWLAGVELALSEIAGVGRLPMRIYLCGGGARLPEVKDALESAKWGPDLHFAGQPVIQFFCPDDVASLTDQTGLLRTVQDVTPLALANLGLELSREEALLSGLLRQAIKLVKN